MKKRELESSLLFLLAAAIWGFAFIAQRVGSKYLGPYTFNGVRFALGALSLLPLIFYFNRKKDPAAEPAKLPRNKTILAGIMIGTVLFIAAMLQQIGLVSTTAGKAAFITGLYIVLVPIFGIFLKHKTHFNTWIAAILAVIGLYLLSVTSEFTVSKGDLLEIIGSFFWAIHILLIDHYSKRINALILSVIQFTTCSILCMIVALSTETITMNALYQALIPLLYGGIGSVGIAYTLQIVGQKNANPSHAAIILSMEAVFASIGGILVLNESLSLKGYLGCGLMLTGMLLSQLKSPDKQEESA